MADFVLSAGDALFGKGHDYVENYLYMSQVRRDPDHWVTALCQRRWLLLVNAIDLLVQNTSDWELRSQGWDRVTEKLRLAETLFCSFPGKLLCIQASSAPTICTSN